MIPRQRVLALLSSTFLDFCGKVRGNDPSILPEPGNPLRIRNLSEKEDMELADALLENTSVTYLTLETAKYTNSSAEAMAKYVRTSKRLQHIRWYGNCMTHDRAMKQREELMCSFLPAIQESTSLKELHMEFPRVGEPSNLALKTMLTHTQSLRSLSLFIGLEDRAVAAVSSGLKKNTTLRELTLEFSHGATTDVSPILTGLHDHPFLRKLCLRGRGHGVDLTGLETLLLSDTSKITELGIRDYYWCERPSWGLPRVLRALARYPALAKLGLCRCPLGRNNARLLPGVLKALAHRPTLTKLELHCCSLGRDDASLLGMALCNIPSLQPLVL
jgi:hypothetical protein